MNDTKAWYESKGVWGSLISIIALVVGLFGVHNLTPEVQAQLSDNLATIGSALGVVVGSIVALYGRLTAKTTIAPKQ